MSLALSPLERAIVELVAKENWPGFRVESLRVKKREDTGVGRYVHFEDPSEQVLVDGSYGAQGRVVEMQGIRNGLYFVIEVSSSRIDYLELVTGGDDLWDGVEREWRIA
jgi:hypothetical protein